MTKERLEAYRSKKDEILELEYALNNRWKSDLMIGNDVVFDYSKGYPMPQSVVGFDQRKYYIDGRKSVSQQVVAKIVHMDRSRVSRKIDDYMKNAQKAQKAQI